MVEFNLIKLQSWGLRGRKTSPFRAGMDSPLTESLNTSFSKHLLVMLMTLLPSSIEGLMGLREEHQSSLLFFRGLELGNESPLCGGYLHTPNAKWEWFSEPLDCPPNEGCKPEPMVGTMNPLGGNPRPSRAGRRSVEISDMDSLTFSVESSIHLDDFIWRIVTGSIEVKPFIKVTRL